MSSKGHRDESIDLNKPYEENVVQLKGIIGFGIGLFLLIVITFALMAALINVLRQYRVESDGPSSPMVMNDKERLPPEPRLQLAPGFGVDSEKGRVNMELAEPQAEYLEVKKQAMAMWEHGVKDPKTGAVTMLPIDEAKERLLTQNVKAKSDPQSAELYERSHMVISDASSGRMASLKRR